MNQPVTEIAHIQQKYENLTALLRSLGKTAVAFSGGVDSAFLLAAANEAPAEALVALTMKRPYIAEWELDDANELIHQLGVKHRIIEMPVDEEVRKNVPNRCYFCKSSTFRKFQEEIELMGYDTLLDGSNADDIQEYRPGLRALREQKVRSPLKEVGLTKQEIRILSEALGLPTADKPSNTCLVTRVPYNTHVSDEDLKKIETAEWFLIREGFEVVRVRKHGDLARIEVSPNRVEDLLEPDMMKRVSGKLKDIGFREVTVEMEGYRSGSMDDAILKRHG